MRTRLLEQGASKQVHDKPINEFLLDAERSLIFTFFKKSENYGFIAKNLGVCLSNVLMGAFASYGSVSSNGFFASLHDG